MDFIAISDTLPVERRLALAYTPARARGAVLALLALDCRMAGLVRDAREPVLGQIKLAWWREQICQAPGQRVAGEPLLELIGCWGDRGSALIALVDGWELALGNSDDTAKVIAGVAQGRAQAAATLAEVLGHGNAAAETARAARGWSIAEFAGSLEQSASAADEDWRALRLPRDLRALAVLFGLARRSRGTGPLLSGPLAGLAAIRLGLFGS